MKKFITDNIALLVILAVALAGFAVYRQYKASKAETTTDTKSETTTTV